MILSSQCAAHYAPTTVISKMEGATAILGIT